MSLFIVLSFNKKYFLQGASKFTFQTWKIIHLLTMYQICGKLQFHQGCKFSHAFLIKIKIRNWSKKVGIYAKNIWKIRAQLIIFMCQLSPHVYKSRIISYGGNFGNRLLFFFIFCIIGKAPCQNLKKHLKEYTGASKINYLAT